MALTVLIVNLGMHYLNMSNEDYFKDPQFIHFLLGAATVSVLSAVGLARFPQMSQPIIGSLYAKSVTAPIAIGIAERIHVSPSLTAVSTVLTGMLGAIFAHTMLNVLQVKSTDTKHLSSSHREVFIQGHS